MIADHILLEMRGITKRYGGVSAVDNVDFTLRKGEIHALLGENGAGKSTLTKLMAGVTTPSSGEIILDGKPVSFSSPAEAMKHGINMCSRKTAWCRR